MEPHPLAEQFGRNLQRCRGRAGLSQEEAALAIGIYTAQVSFLERGLRLPRIETIVRVSAGLGVTPCVLLSGLHWSPGYSVEGHFYVDDRQQPSDSKDLR